MFDYDLLDILNFLKFSFIIIQILIFGVILASMKIDKARSLFDNKSILLITAHPDDEAMFFLPFINAFHSTSKIHLLCLSTGDVDGLGKTREKELAKVVDLLGIYDYALINDPELPDGMNKPWDKALIQRYVQTEVNKRNIEIVVTFDNYGVSGHINHISINAALTDMKLPNVYELKSTNILRKYIGILDCYSTLLNNISILNVNPKLIWKAMTCHYSQFVWYRKLFVLFSRYAYLNTFQQIH